MPQKLNKAGQMQDYIPKGNGDANGEYGTSNGTNKNFTASDKKKSQANVITENKSVVVENKGKKERLTSERYLTPDEWKKVYDLSKEKNKKFDKLVDEVYKLQDKYDYDTETAINKVKEKYSDNSNKANVIDGDLTGKKETKDYDAITYPKGTSKEYTMKVDKEYQEALPILKKYGIDIKEFGSWEDKDAFADKYEEITKKYVFDRYEKETNKTNQVWKEKGYQELFDALEKVEDKQYNDWWIKNKK